MSMKCRRNLVRKPKRTPNTHSRTFTVCSAIKHGYEQVRAEKDRMKRESLFTHDNAWIGKESRPGMMDLREEILLRDGPIGAMCRETFHPYAVQVDHIILRVKFKNPTDADRLENLQVLCTNCHRAKTKIDRKVLSRVR